MSCILVDTCMWSLALRGKIPKEKKVAKQLAQFIEENRARIIGPIRQEVLFGYSNHQHYEQLKNKLRYFPNVPILDTDYEVAAEYSNTCRKKGVQGSHIDFLICAVASRLKMIIYTRDKDFENYSAFLSISLYQGQEG